MIRDLLPALSFTISRSAWPLIFASDSEGASSTGFGGFGIVAQVVSAAEWSQTLRVGIQPNFTVCRLDGSTHHLRNQLKELKARIPVPRIPSQILEPSRHWVPIASGRWKYREHITLTEGRATNILLQRLALVPSAHGKRHIGLCDNMGWSAATAKGRSPAFALNQLLRRRTSLIIATDMQVLHPWVDTHRMPADSLSRQS